MGNTVNKGRKERRYPSLWKITGPRRADTETRREKPRKDRTVRRQESHRSDPPEDEEERDSR